MKSRLLIGVILSFILSSCNLFYKIEKENGREYYINKKGEKIYVKRLNEK